MNKILVFAVMLPVAVSAATYYASPDGTGTGTDADPCSLSAGIDKVEASTHTLILKSGRYLLSGAIAVTGAKAAGNRVTIIGETGDPADVILDARGNHEVMRLARNVFVSGLTMMNGCNETSALATRAAGVRIGYNTDPDTLSIVSNCVVTCCTNVFDESSKSGGNVIYGGAVCVYDTGLLVDSLVTNNTAVYRSAGVVVKNGKVKGCTVSGNKAEQGGGGVFCERGSTAYIADSMISNNSTTEGEGGGVACYFGDSSFVLTNCTVCGNSADRGGGVAGAWNTALHAEIVDCVITNNTSQKQGGGVHVRDDVTSDLATRFVLRNSLVAFNKTKDAGAAGVGGGVYLVSYANPVIDSCTIVSNASNYGGAGIYHRWSGTVTNSIVAFNVKGASLEAGKSWCLQDSDSNAVPSAYVNCCVWPAVEDVFLSANGCKNADPKFADAVNGDFTLRGSSPCREAGLFESWMANAFDLSGNKRVEGDVPDIGCFEYKPVYGLTVTVQ